MPAIGKAIVRPKWKSNGGGSCRFIDETECAEGARLRPAQNTWACMIILAIDLKLEQVLAVKNFV